MRETVDLVGRYGEGWCLTLVRRPLGETLAAMGVETSRQEEVGPPSGEGEEADPPPRLSARSPAGGWTLVVETSGAQGWIGEREEVLESLSQGNATALSLVLDPGTDLISYAEDGSVVLRFEPSLAEVEGVAAQRFRAALEGAGFVLGEGERLPPHLEALPGGQLALYGAELIWGQRMTADMFDGLSGWVGGVSHL